MFFKLGIGRGFIYIGWPNLIQSLLKIMTLLEFMYSGKPIHFQRRVQKEVKKWNKNHS
jgi:hypothetical protein